ncbi:MAG: ABC transporter ATP-binding protein [Lachnospiraceae bacterium]|nr:ABC transporter ATP-binding protein [Lachnospiraceae bacterium]
MKLETKSLSVKLDKKEIVHQATLQVEDGAFVGLIGPNGSGKTTLLKSIYRVLKPSGGVAMLDGQDIRAMSHKESAQAMGVVSQFTNLNFDFSVEDIVLMGRSPHKGAFDRDTAADYQIVEDCLRRVDMLEFRDRSFLTLSGGEKQRILLARALAQQVKILVLDEPTNHLDIKYQIQIMEAVKATGVGVLAALHDLNLTLMYCTYLYVLKDGNVVAHGTPEEIITEELIREVYEVDCQVMRHEASGRMYVVYLSRSRNKK